MDLARFLLDHRETQPLPPSHATATKLRQVWQVRLATSASTRQILYGAKELVDTLSRMPGDVDIDQYPFIGRTLIGLFFFSSAAGQYIGMVVTSRRAPPETKWWELA